MHPIQCLSGIDYYCAWSHSAYRDLSSSVWNGSIFRSNRIVGFKSVILTTLKSNKNILKRAPVNNSSLPKQQCNTHFIFSFLEMRSARQKQWEKRWLLSLSVFWNKVWNVLEGDIQISSTEGTIHFISQFLSTFCLVWFWFCCCCFCSLFICLFVFG